MGKLTGIPSPPGLRDFLLLGLIASLTLPGCATQSPYVPTPPREKDHYVAGFVTKSSPTGSDLTLGGDKIPQSSFSGSTGGGVKIGTFLPIAKRVFGGEIELFGHGGRIKAPQTTDGGIRRSADLSMSLFAAMANVIARYPGDFIQPYVGFGAGLVVIDLNGPAQSQAGYRQGKTTLGGGIQGLAGVRMNVTKHIFLFTEYKHLISTAEEGEGDDCGEKNQPSCPPLFGVDFQSHYLSMGAGIRF